MPFAIGNKVWFRASGTTPYIKGNPANPSAPAGAQLGGRGDPEVSRYSKPTSGLFDAQGVPSIDFEDFPGASESSDTVLTGPLSEAPAQALVDSVSVYGLVETGVHKYAATYVTADGETIPGPLLSVAANITPSAPVGALVSPTAAPTPAPTGALVPSTTAPSSAPTGALVPSIAAPSAPVAALEVPDTPGNVNDGAHSYKVTYTTAYGETTPSATSNVITIADKTVNGQVDVTIPVGPTGVTGRKLYRTDAGDVGNYKLIATIANNVDVLYTDNIADGAGAAAPITNTSQAGNIENGTHSYKTTFVTAYGETTPSVTSNVVTVVDKTLQGQVALTAIAVGPAGVTSRKIYRTVAGDAGNYKLLTTIANNTATTYTDNTADAGLGADAPITNTSQAGNIENGTHSYKTTFVTAYGETTPSVTSNVVTVVDKTLQGQVALTAIAVGPTGTVSRRVYRTVTGNAGNYKLLATIADNVTTIYTDNTADAGLGADAPITNTSQAGNIENGTHSYKVVFVSPTGDTLPSAKSNVVTVVDKTLQGQVALTAIPVGPTGTVSRKVYRTVATDVAPWKLLATIANNVDTTYTDNTADGGLGANAPVADAGKVKVSVGNIPVGPVGTTARKLYRTLTGATQLKLLTTLSNNTTTVYVDNTADGALGANAPTSEGSVVGSTLTSAGAAVGVIEQTVKNPLAPKIVTTQGRWDGGTPAGMLPDALDDGKVDDVAGTTNALRTINPNLPFGRKTGIVAQGTAIPVSGSQDFVSEVINVKGNTVGVRLPSSMEDAGVVIEISNVTNAGKSPDGTTLRVGDKLVLVNWGASIPSNPHKVKWYNRHRIQWHAEADLIAA